MNNPYGQRLNVGAYFEKEWEDIFKDPAVKSYNTWQQILPLLGMTSCHFIDKDEEHFAFEWFKEKISLYTGEWVENHRGRVLTEYNHALDRYRNDRKKQEEKRRKKKDKRKKRFWEKKSI